MSDAAGREDAGEAARVALILFAHGARDAAWREPVDALVRRVQALLPQVDVVPAFLETMRPSLGEAVQAAVAAGAQRIAVAPVFWAAGRHLKRDVPELLGQVCAQHPSVQIDLWTVLGERDAVLDAIAADYCAAWSDAGPPAGEGDAKAASRSPERDPRAPRSA